MRGQERLSKLIGPVVDGLGYELVGVEFDSRQRILRVYIDHEQGITLDDCSKVSYHLSGFLDVEDPVQGHLVRLQLIRPINQQRRFKARLLGMEGNDVLLQDGEAVLRIPFDSIDKARLVPEFDK
jgi:ribosome maturation factor RimP